MTPELVSLIVISLIASVAALLIKLQKSREAQGQLQKERDIEKIKSDAKAEIQNTNLQHLVDKLNRRMSADGRKPLPSKRN